MSPNTDSIFYRLAPLLQRWLWEQGWTGLRPMQAEAIEVLLASQQDVIITASTASGKTEAAFLPLLTRLWEKDGTGVLLYVAPMKALINDQFERMEMLCRRLEIPIYPWHGDIGATSRKRFIAAPRGLVLITPESLESLLFRRGDDVPQMFAQIEAVVIDELHAFIGNERGRQLQSLLHRLESTLARRVQRVGLSATLGDIRLAEDFLRRKKRECTEEKTRVIVGTAEQKTIQLLMKTVPQESGDDAKNIAAHTLIAENLFQRLRQSNYLIFPNSTGMVEFYADALRRQCEANDLPVTFFPHHGRLGKVDRESTESSLKRGDLPVSAICTSTLEMGIDIGAIRGVVQIGPPESVAALCQRIGRAGRRDRKPAELWQYCLTAQGATDALGGLQLDLVQCLAVIRLFLAKWYEPPSPGGLHYSTLIQQVMSLIGERRGLSAAATYQVLCKEGPFSEVSETDFIELLRSLAALGLIMQDANLLLLLGEQGEKIANHYTFFAAFQDSREYRLRHEGKELGTLPLRLTHAAGDTLIFTGRRWQIAEIDHGKRRVELRPATIGNLPKTGGRGLPVHDRVREEMRIVLAGEDLPAWLDVAGIAALASARAHFSRLNLAATPLICEDKVSHLFTWRGDATQEALVYLLRAQGVIAANVGVCLRVYGTSKTEVSDALRQIAESDLPQAEKILDRAALGCPEKWDWALPDRLFYDGFAASRLDLPAAHELAQNLWTICGESAKS